MKRLTERGFSKAEIIIGLCAILVLLAILIKALSDSSDDSNYSHFRRQADNFASRVAVYKDMYERRDNTYYLDYLLDDNYTIDVVNPFDKTTECDRYESYVKIFDGKKEVNLKCGNYLAIGMEGGNYYIYEVSSWSKDAVNGEFANLYNYKKNGVLVGEDYMLENEFIDFYNNKEKKSVNYIYEINDSSIEILIEGMYREKKLVKEFK